MPKMSEPFVAVDSIPEAFEEDTERADLESLEGEQDVNATVPMSEGANFHVSAAGSPYEDTNPEEKVVLLHRISDLEKELQAVINNCWMRKLVL